MSNQKRTKSVSDIDYGALDTLIGYRLRRAQVSFFNGFAERFSKYGITPGLFGVLSVVKNNPGSTQTSIANALGNDRSAMVGVVDRLEGLNLVERKPAIQDRRSHALFLTDEGEKFYKKMIREVKQHEQEYCALLDDGELELLMDILERFAAVHPSSATKK